VNAAIFYNIWQYYNATGDTAFLWAYGAEMMLEIARFWASIAHHNPQRGRYEIHGVMGPDEYHEQHVGSDEHGLHNNAYTNVMVAWICDVALNVLEMLPLARREALAATIGLSDEEVKTWQAMSTAHVRPVPRR
jgi:trehalose/maltose hydrolase-like predicted phosphorylase